MAEIPKNAKIANISYISIASDGNYFDTQEQIHIRDRKFSDRGTSVNEFATRRRTNKLNSPTNVEIYPISSYLPDASGNLRSILSTGINHYASSSVLAYRTGVEITREADWIAGTVKISAGTPGHIFDRTSLGVSDMHLISSNSFTELDNFSPIHFLQAGGDPALITYPVVIGSVSLDDMNGLIEPFPLRSVIYGKSIFYPHEPYGVRGSYGNGNIDTYGAADEVVSVYSPLAFTAVPFLDDSQPITLDDGSNIVVLGTMGFVNRTIKYLSPFDEIISDDNPTGTTYLRDGEVTSPAGWDWDGNIRGTDSVAFGGRGATRGRKRLGSRALLNERDSKHFISDGNIFNDMNTIVFTENDVVSAYTIQYPEMLPVGYVYTNEDGSRHTLIDNVGGIKSRRGTKPGLIVWNLT